jgi:transposase
VFIDETAASTKMVRLNGRCPRGVRLIGHAPHGHWKTITFVAGLRNDGMVAPFVFDGPMSGPTFVTYIQQCLASTLARRDTVVMDNLAAHKVVGVRQAIEAVSARLRYLPQYSPDFNPIEQGFSKVKSKLRKAAERTVKGLCRRIGLISRSFKNSRMYKFLQACGVRVNVSGICSSRSGVDMLDFLLVMPVGRIACFVRFVVCSYRSAASMLLS